MNIFRLVHFTIIIYCQKRKWNKQTTPKCVSITKLKCTILCIKTKQKKTKNLCR